MTNENVYDFTKRLAGLPVDRDATVDPIERTFDDECQSKVLASAPAENGNDEEHGDDRDEHEAEQNQRLTLLPGGVKRGNLATSGVPVSTTALDFVTPAGTFSRLSARHEEPLMRYKPEHTAAPIWSADAGWHDLTHRQTIEPVTDLPRGWTSQWFLTYRHGLNDLMDSVANVSAGDLLAADPIRRNSWHKKKTSRAGLRYVTSTGRLHAHESLFERKLLCVLDFHGAAQIASQPFTLTWHDGTRERSHTPDFLALMDGQITVINTRPAALVKDRLLEDCGAVAEMCMSRGWEHALVTGYPLPHFTIIETVEAHAGSEDLNGYSEDLLDHLDTNGPTSFEALTNRCDAPPIARGVLQRLIWDREVSIDLTELLSDATLVHLPGREVRS